MSNKQLFKGFLLSLAVMLGSCSDCEETVNESTQNGFQAPTQAEFNQIQQTAFDNSIQTASFPADEGITFTSENGVTFTINPGCLSLNGQLATGIATLEFSEFFNRGEMLVANAPTVGMDVNGNLDQLISGGEFFIRATQDGEALTLDCPSMIDIPTSLTGGDDNLMRPFTGIVGADGTVIWVESNGELFLSQDAQGNSVYTSFIENFGWFNCDRFANNPGPTTEVQIAIPQEFDSANSAVYLALQGEPNSLAFLYGELPVGLDAHIIFISEADGFFRYAIESLRIAENQQVIFTLQETNVASAEDLISILNNLP